MTAYATLTDLSSRYPQELILLAADETTGLRDDARITLALADASAEIRAILQARYTPDELARLDGDSLAILAIYTMDIALYRVALSFARSTDAIKERRDQAIRMLQAIAAGKGALTVVGEQSGSGNGAALSGDGDVAFTTDARFFPRRSGRLFP